MAQRRRPPRQHRDRRNGTHNKAHQQQQQQLPPSPPDEDVDIVPSGQLRGRLSSSVGSPSERGTSESTHTDMTSMHNTDDEEGDDEGTSGMTRAMPMDVDDDDDGRTARHEPASTASLLSPSAAIAARDDDQDEDDDEDLRSIYAHTTTAATHNYPQVATSYRTETPFRVTTGSLAGNSDLYVSHPAVSRNRWGVLGLTLTAQSRLDPLVMGPGPRLPRDPRATVLSRVVHAH